MGHPLKLGVSLLSDSTPCSMCYYVSMVTKLNITRACRNCSMPMAIRRNKATGHLFLGGTQWPACTHTEPGPIHMGLEAMGAERLPGM